MRIMEREEKLSPMLMQATRQRIRRRFIDVKKLIDPWSVPHFLFGVVMAFAVIAFASPVFMTFFATLGLALLWELLERYFRLREVPENAWMDVLLPLISFTAIYTFAINANLDVERGQALFVVSFLIYMCVNFFAWRARFDHDRDFRW